MTLDPTTHPYILFCVNNIAEEPTFYFKGIASDGGQSSVAGDFVGTIQTGLPGVNFTASSMTPSTERRPLLASDGFGNLGIQGTSGRSLRINTTGYANDIHINRQLWAIVVFKMDASVGLATRWFTDTTNAANSDAASATGFGIGSQAFSNGTSWGGIFRKTNGLVPRVRLKNSTTTPIIDLMTEEDLSEASPTVHVLICRVEPTGLSEIQVDNGRKAYGRTTTTAGSGNSVSVPYIMERLSSSVPMPGILLAMGVYTQYPGDEYLEEWLTRWPKGAFSGSSEARVGNFHLNFSKDQAGMPYCIWFEGIRVSATTLSSGNEHGQNVVFNDGVSTDYLGGAAGWCGGPHRNEVLNSATVSIDGATPVAYQTGQLYEGQSSVEIVRNTTIGISFDQTETHTITSNTERVNTVLTRKGDARSINPLVFRSTRDQTYQDYLVFDAAGAVMHSGSVTASAFTCDPGAVAVAQWSPTGPSSNGVLALTIATIGPELVTTEIGYIANESRRIYHYLISKPTGTNSVEFETLTKFYVTTAAGWEALAQAEILAHLFPPSSGGRSNPFNLGLGLNSLINQ